MEQQRFVLLPTVGGAWVIRDTQDGSPVCVLFHGGRGIKKTRCEQSRKLRISVTKIENGPDRFF